MKKIISILSITAFTAFVAVISGCTAYFGYERIKDDNLQSTDLSNVTIAGLRLGSNTNNIEMSIFRKTDKGYTLYGFVNDETYPDEVYIHVEPDGIITRIDGRVHIGLEFEINGVDSPQSLQEIKNELGSNFNDYFYSSELGYNAITYTDAENNINLTFLYSIHDDSLIWAILSLP